MSTTLGLTSDITGVAQRSEDLRRYLTFLIWPHLFGMTALLGIALLTRSQFVMFWFVALLINGVFTYAAYRRVMQKAAAQAVYLYIAGLTVIMVALFAWGYALYPLAMAMIFLPVMMGMPYLSERGVMGVCVFITVLVSLGAASTMILQPLSMDIDDDVFRWSATTMVILVNGVTALTLWYNAMVLKDSEQRLVRLNEQLKGSERRLEEQVAERTRELEQAIVDLQAARDEAEQADSQKTDFIARMSHELRTPLNAVIGFSELLQHPRLGELNERQRDYLNDILASARHLLLLINDILDLSKVSTGETELSCSEFDFLGLANSALSLIEHRTQIKSLELRREGLDQVGRIEGDERKLKQVLINLLGNAVKFTQNGGRITLGAGRDGDALEVWVEDTGVGIEAEQQSRVFETFERTGDAAGVEGTGLGLSVSRQLVELHGGTIGLDSVPGKGSRFHFRIPSTQTSRGKA